MRKTLFVSVTSVLLFAAASWAIESPKAHIFAGQDLYLQGRQVISHQPSPGKHTLVFQGGFSMSIGANRFSSDSAVVWLESVTTEFRGRVRVDINVKAYLQGNISVEKGKAAKTIDLSWSPVKTRMEKGRSLVVRFSIGGEVFVTADERKPGDPRGLELYKNAVAAVVPVGPEFVVQREALVPEWPVKKRIEKPVKEVVVAKPSKPEPVKRAPKPGKQMVKPTEAAPDLIRGKPEVKEPVFRYPVNIAGIGESAPKFERTTTPNGPDILTVTGRFYLWQKKDERGGLLELQADNAVIFYSGEALDADEQSRLPGSAEDILSGVAVESIYMSGDVVYTCGQRTIRADELYYDFQRSKALAINAVMRSFDVRQGIPIYVRAARLRQLAENKFAGENITLTSSEFYKPQISLSVSSVVITDTTTIDEQLGELSDSSYDAQMRDVRMKLGERTIFYWPFLRSNLQRPDIPLKSIHTGRDSTWGVSVETRWHLARLLGLREPKGTDSTFAFDYYEKRGIGIGAEIDYARKDYFGRILGYVIRDSGEDDLGRYYERRNLEPPRELRGRFLWRHRQFLPYNWQLTTEVSYASDEHFIEGYYRNEFDVGKEQETLVHLKRIEDNWGLSILGKMRINDFVNKLEELPSVEFHLTGQSLFDDRLTFYSDSQASRFRQRLTSKGVSEEFFTFLSERAELDMPISWLVPGVSSPIKVVPFVAGTLAYEDGSGFYRKIDGSTADREDEVWLGEAGVRVFTPRYWKVYPDVNSRLWDLNELRHIITPYLTASMYAESDSVVKQRDMLNIGISQRLQTKRGVADNRRTVDWMRLDMDVTWVDDSAGASDSGPGPDRFIWNKPFIPVQSRRSSNIFGPRRNYFGADYIWRLSDTSAVLSDMNFDMQSGVVQQFNIGFSHLRWPDFQFYIGSRYLRRFINGHGEKGTNVLTFAATYILDPRYRIVFSQQYDFDYGKGIRNEITLIRRYHRMYWAISWQADHSLDNEAIVFSIWPQGVPELAIGPRRYIGLGGSADY